MSLGMSQKEKEREEFLAGVHNGVVAIPDGERGPLPCSIWYAYEPQFPTRGALTRPRRSVWEGSGTANGTVGPMGPPFGEPAVACCGSDGQARVGELADDHQSNRIDIFASERGAVLRYAVCTRRGSRKRR